MESGNAVDWFVDRHGRDGAGERQAFQDPWRSLTYAALEQATRRFAGALAAAGIDREQRLLILLQDTIDFPIAFWGALRAGVVPVPINTLLTADTVRYILADSRAVGAVVSEALVEGLAPVLADLAACHRLARRRQRSELICGRGWVGLPNFLASGDPATPTADAASAMRWHSGCTPPDRPARRRASGTSIPACASPPRPTAPRCWASVPTT